MTLYIVFLGVLLGLVQNSNTKVFTADLDKRLNRERRDIHNAELIPLSLLITSKISSRFANTLVTSKLQNKSPNNREAKFVVHLPETAFISNFSMKTFHCACEGKERSENGIRESQEQQPKHRPCEFH